MRTILSNISLEFIVVTVVSKTTRKSILILNMVNQIYPPELQFNKANTTDIEAPFLDLHLSIANIFFFFYMYFIYYSTIY